MNKDRKIGVLKLIKEDRLTCEGLARCIRDIRNVVKNKTFKVGDIIINTNSYLNNKYWEPVRPIIIYSDNKIKSGDKVLYKNEDIRTVIDSKDIILSSDFKKKKYGSWCTEEVVKELENHYKKILVLPNKFSPKDIQLIIKGKLKDGDKVEVEIEELMKESEEGGGYLYYIKDGIVQGFSNTTLPIEELQKEGWELVNRLKLNNNFAIIHLYKSLIDEAASEYAKKCNMPFTNNREINAFIAGVKWAKENL